MALAEESICKNQEVDVGKKRDIEQRIGELRDRDYPENVAINFLAEILRELDEIRKLLEGPED